MKLSALKESDMILHTKEESFRALLDSTWAALKVAEIGRFSQRTQVFGWLIPPRGKTNKTNRV